MPKPIILVTNDDGITAPGIKALVEVAAELGELYIVAPDKPQSGMGHAITISSPLRLHPSTTFSEHHAYECSGTPVDCVKLGRQVLLKEQDIALCISGINHGSNAAVNILYSGTMSAAMEASLEGIPSIGFSLLDFSYDADFEAAKPYIRSLIKQVLATGLNGGQLLNVNIPKLPFEAIKGIKVCRQANARWIEEFAEATDPRGEKYYWMTGKFENLDIGEDTDIWALENGYISVVPSHHDLTDYMELMGLKASLENLI